MSETYRIDDTSEIFSPALVVFQDVLERNLDRLTRIAGSPARLRPHCKTHKMPAVAKIELARGIVKHKCATLAEAEMLADAGVRDVFLAYNLVGPNIRRAAAFVARYPDVRLFVTGDHPDPVRELGAALAAGGRTIGVALDLDVGQHRTGLPLGDQAFDLYRLIANTPGLEPAGLHVYDGHRHESSLDERRAAVLATWKEVVAFRDKLKNAGLAVPRIVAGGTPSFPIYASLDDPLLELSPGTTVLHDCGYGERFPDLQFEPAALVLTRCISRPTPDRVTFDLGYKAVASDPPAGQRLVFPDLPDAVAVLQNEEHLVVQTSKAGEFKPGDELLAIPRHVCPTSALHRQAWVVRDGHVVDRWEVTARDRWITV